MQSYILLLCQSSRDHNIGLTRGQYGLCSAGTIMVFGTVK